MHNYNFVTRIRKWRALAIIVQVFLLGYLACDVQGQTNHRFDYPNLSEGHNLMLYRGLQTQALVWPAPGFTFDHTLMAQGNFTSVNLQSLPEYVSTALGAPEYGGDYDWGFISGQPTQTYLPWPLMHYKDRLINLQFCDEFDITDMNMRQKNKEAFQVWRATYPNTICHTNDYGSEQTYFGQGGWSLVDILDFVADVKPDMVMHDTYPYHAMPTAQIAVNDFYEACQKYRIAGLTGHSGKPIPYGTWLQCYEMNPLRPRISQSEVYMQLSVPMTMGYTFFSYFYYNNDEMERLSIPIAPFHHTFLFDGDGDQNPTSDYAYYAQANLHAKNFGETMVRLISDDIRFIRGKHTTVWPFTADNTIPANIQEWDSNADSLITSIDVTNVGSENNGLDGDVFVGYFSLLDESFDGSSYTGESYVMITNALTSTTGSSYDCRQQVVVYFDFAGVSIPAGLQYLDGVNPNVQTMGLTYHGGTAYSVTLVIGGGMSCLFKYDNGAPFVGLQPIPTPEPSTCALLLCGFVGFMKSRRRRQR